MNVHLTNTFAQAAEGFGTVRTYGQDVWKVLLSLINTAPTVKGEPLKPVHGFLEKWKSALQNNNCRESGAAIASIFEDFSREQNSVSFRNGKNIFRPGAMDYARLN